MKLILVKKLSKSNGNFDTLIRTKIDFTQNLSGRKINNFLHCVGLQNYKLKWKGPYARTDKANRYPDKLKEDTLRVSKIGCDVVVFLVFNDFSSGQDVAGHKYSGFAGTYSMYSV